MYNSNSFEDAEDKGVATGRKKKTSSFDHI
jgi:hypothetical protein